MWILVPWPGIEPASPALEGRFLTTEPPGKSLALDSWHQEFVFVTCFSAQASVCGIHSWYMCSSFSLFYSIHCMKVPVFIYPVCTVSCLYSESAAKNILVYIFYWLERISLGFIPKTGIFGSRYMHIFNYHIILQRNYTSLYSQYMHFCCCTS